MKTNQEVMDIVGMHFRALMNILKEVESPFMGLVLKSKEDDSVVAALAFGIGRDVEGLGQLIEIKQAQSEDKGNVVIKGSAKANGEDFQVSNQSESLGEPVCGENEQEKLDKMLKKGYIVGNGKEHKV